MLGLAVTGASSTGGVQCHLKVLYAAEHIAMFSNVQASGGFQMLHLGTIPILQRRELRLRRVNSEFKGDMDPRVGP